MFPFVHHHVPGVLKSLLIPASHIPSLDLFPFGHCSASDQQTPPCDTIRSQKIIFLNQESPQWLLPQYHPATTEILRVILRGRRASLARFHRWQAQGREVIYLKLYLKAEVQAGKDPGSSDFQFHYTV